MQTHPLISLHRTTDPISYEAAADLAAAANGFLLTFSISDSDQQQIGDAIDQRFYEDPFWIASSPHPIDEPVTQYAVEYNNTTVVRGSSNADHYLGTIGVNQVIYAGAGDDTYYGSGGGKIYLGDGNDSVALNGGTAEFNYLHERDAIETTIIYDGAGNDSIEGGVVRAAMDGDTDSFYALARLSYADATSDITLDYGFVAQYGDDAGTVYIDGHGSDFVLGLREIVGGAGDDWLSGVGRIQGGDGDDYIAPALYGEGGDGDDTLVTSSSARAELRGGAGNDRLLLYNSAKAGGGSGDDTFVFLGGAGIALNDFHEGDILDFSSLTDLSASELFSSGTLDLTYVNGYTKLWWDEDGSDGALAAYEIARIKQIYSQASLEDWIVT